MSKTCVLPDGAPSGLVGAEACLEIVWPDERSRPCLRTFRRLQRQRLIPVYYLGRRTYFDPAQVRAAIDRQFVVSARP